MKKRNGIIGISKFVFAILILFSHSGDVRDGGIKHSFCRCGAIGVDFFFLVSGYLLAKKVAGENRRGDATPLYKSTWRFLFGKIRVFYPYLLVSYVLLLILHLYAGKWGAFEYLDSMNDLFLIQSMCPDSTRIIGASWYVSAMIMAMLFVYPMLKTFGKTFSFVIAPLMTIVWGGYVFHSVSSLRAWSNFCGILPTGLSKAVLEISLGCLVYEWSEYIRRIRFTSFARILLGIVQTAFFCFVIFMNAAFDWVRRLDWMFIILLASGIAIAFSDQIPWTRWADNKLFAYLERLSTPIYLNNFVGITLVNDVQWFQRFSWRERCVVMCGIVFLLSVAELWGIERLRKLDYSRLKRLFIAAESEKERA